MMNYFSLDFFLYLVSRMKLKMIVFFSTRFKIYFIYLIKISMITFCFAQICQNFEKVLGLPNKVDKDQSAAEISM